MGTLKTAALLHDVLKQRKLLKPGEFSFV